MITFNEIDVTVVLRPINIEQGPKILLKFRTLSRNEEFSCHVNCDYFKQMNFSSRNFEVSIFNYKVMSS